MIDDIKPSILLSKTVTQNYTTHDREVPKMLLLMRRLYNLMELPHLHNKSVGKLNRQNEIDVAIPTRLVQDLFNYLQVKDEAFRETTIKRQKRYRRRLDRARKAWYTSHKIT
jgi:hypothetical protein